MEVYGGNALAKEGFKMNWLLEKQEPDIEMYENDKGIMTPANKQKYKAKLEEIEAKEMKVFGILLSHIEPASRAFSLIGLEKLMKRDPVVVFNILKKSFNNTKTVAGLFGAIEKSTESGPAGEDILAFLNRNYSELDHYAGYGEKKTDGETVQPNAIPEAMKVLMVFVKARKSKTFAFQLGNFITENIFTLSFDDPDFNFKSIYEKLLTFLRHRKFSAQGNSVQSPAVFTTRVFSAMVRKEFKKFDQERPGNHGKGPGKRFDDRRGGHFRNPKRPKSAIERVYPAPMWDCTKCGRNKDHSTKFCPLIHPGVAEKIKVNEMRKGGRHEIKGWRGNRPPPPLLEEIPKDNVSTTAEVNTSVVEPMFTFGVH